MGRNEHAESAVRDRQQSIRRQVERTVDQMIDEPLASATRGQIDDVQPGIVPIITHLCGKITGPDRRQDEIQTVATAIAFVRLHVAVHARVITGSEEGTMAILVGDLLRSLADRTIHSSSLSGTTIESVSRSCAMASCRALEQLDRTRDPNDIDPTMFASASEAGVALGDGGDRLQSFVESFVHSENGAPPTRPERFADDRRFELLETILAGRKT